MTTDTLTRTHTHIHSLFLSPLHPSLSLSPSLSCSLCLPPSLSLSLPLSLSDFLPLISFSISHWGDWEQEKLVLYLISAEPAHLLGPFPFVLSINHLKEVCKRRESKSKCMLRKLQSCSRQPGSALYCCETAPNPRTLSSDSAQGIQTISALALPLFHAVENQSRSTCLEVGETWCGIAEEPCDWLNSRLWPHSLGVALESRGGGRPFMNGSCDW